MQTSKKVVYTYEQLNSLARLYEGLYFDRDFILQGTRFQWLQKLLDDRNVIDYVATGFNGDNLIDFHFWRYKPTSFTDALEWVKNFVLYHKIRVSYKLGLLFFGFNRTIPSYEEVVIAYYDSIAESDEDLDRLHEDESKAAKVEKVQVKCDCCGRMFNILDMELLVVPEKEFDGAACESCRIELLSRD